MTPEMRARLAALGTELTPTLLQTTTQAAGIHRCAAR